MTILIENEAAAAGPVPAISWAAIIAGAVAAAAATLVLLALGSGLGLAAATTAHGPSVATFGAMTAIWLIATQWISAALGGYLAGRLRTRWVGTHAHEIFFRDTAHGFLTWALATVAAAAVLTPTISAATGAGVAAAAGGAPDADAAARAAAALSLYTALSMMVGAFIASVAAALGGHERDLHP